MLNVTVARIGELAVVGCEGRIVQRESTYKLREAVTSQIDARIIVVELSAVRAIGGGENMTGGNMHPSLWGDRIIHSLREIHAAQQVLVAWLKAQVIEGRIRIQQHHPVPMPSIGIFQPLKRLIFVTQGRINSAHEIWSYILFLGKLA